MVSLSGVEVLFLALAVVSLVINIIQFRDARASREPLANTLVGMFNDIKQKSNNVAFTYAALFNTTNPHKEVKTLQWEYGLFVQTMNTFLIGAQEQVVGLLRSLRPDDKEGKLAFRASDYGLNDQDKAIRQKSLEQYLNQMGAAPGGPKEDDPTK